MIPLSTISRQEATTPRWLYDEICSRLGVTCKLDAAADAANSLCAAYYDEATDGLTAPWADVTWCNPPYRRIGPWIAKARYEQPRGARSLLLVPAAVSSGWYCEARDHCVTILLAPRIAYGGYGGHAPPHGSMVLYFPEKSIGYPRILHWDLRGVISALGEGSHKTH